MRYNMDRLLEWGRELEVDPEASAFRVKRLLRVRDRKGNVTALKPNAAQLAFERNRTRSNIILKARQMGITTWIAGRFFLKTITQPGVLSVQVAHTRPAAEAIFTVVERMWANLPAALRDGPLVRSRANVGQMVFPQLDSEFRVVSAAEENAGRGLTIQNLHCSEVSRWPGDAATTLAGLRAALVPDGEEVLESTANGAYGCFYEEWMRAGVQTDTARHFFPWWMEKAYTAAAPEGNFSGEELALMQQHGLTPKQIGYRRKLESNFRGLRVQEYAEDAMSCFKASGDCCFELAEIEKRVANLPAPIATRRNGNLQIWLPHMPGRVYLVAVDTAGGGADGDFACIQVIDLVSGLQCAELRERVGVLELARVAASLAREYNGAMIAVERNNHGSGVLAHLDASEHYPCVYEQGGMAGWLTSAGSKPRMVSRMGALLAETPELFLSRRLLEECRSFINLPGGGTGGAPGAHDDCVMAMAVAQAVRAERQKP